jgi:hypothetical protein
VPGFRKRSLFGKLAGVDRYPDPVHISNDLSFRKPGTLSHIAMKLLLDGAGFSESRIVRNGAARCRRALLAVSLLAGTCVTAFAQTAGELPRLNILPGSLTVSGVSSGGYMATQYQIAFSKDVIGAAVIAAGPWYCAQGSLLRALDACTSGSAIGPEIQPLVSALRASAEANEIDDPSWVAPDRIWLFHGARDAVIGAAVGDSLLRFYRELVPPERIHYETQVAAAHGFPTDGQGGQPTVLTGVEIPLLWRYDATPDGERCHVDLLDWWFFQLYAYDREDGERHHVLIELFGWDVFEWSTGVGELAR